MLFRSRLKTRSLKKPRGAHAGWLAVLSALSCGGEIFENRSLKAGNELHQKNNAALGGVLRALQKPIMRLCCCTMEAGVLDTSKSPFDVDGDENRKT